MTLGSCALIVKFSKWLEEGTIASDLGFLTSDAGLTP